MGTDITLSREFWNISRVVNGLVGSTGSDGIRESVGDGIGTGWGGTGAGGGAGAENTGSNAGGITPVDGSTYSTVGNDAGNC